MNDGPRTGTIAALLGVAAALATAGTYVLERPTSASALVAAVALVAGAAVFVGAAPSAVAVMIRTAPRASRGQCASVVVAAVLLAAGSVWLTLAIAHTAKLDALDVAALGGAGAFLFVGLILALAVVAQLRRPS